MNDYWEEIYDKENEKLFCYVYTNKVSPKPKTKLTPSAYFKGTKLFAYSYLVEKGTQEQIDLFESLGLTDKDKIEGEDGKKKRGRKGEKKNEK